MKGSHLRVGFARDGFMEELSFNLGLERSIEFKLAVESKDNQGRVKSRREGWKELCSGRNKPSTRVRAWCENKGPQRGSSARDEGRQLGI